MQVHACEKVFVIVQAAAQFLVLILKALQWIISWILELVIVPASWIWQDELHLRRASGIKPILEQTVTTHGAHVALANRAVPVEKGWPLWWQCCVAECVGSVETFAVQCFVRLMLEGPTTGATGKMKTRPGKVLQSLGGSVLQDPQ